MSSKKCQDSPAADSPSEMEPVTSPPSSPTMSPSLLPRINEKEDDIACSSDSDVWSLGSDRDINAPELFTISSDSYFSQHRESFGELRGRALDTPISTKKGRRASDLSLRSNIDYSNHTESENEHTKTPSRPGSRRSSTPQNKRSGSSRSRTRDGAPESGSGSEISQTAKIFKNLLILEESLRQQNVEQKLLRRKYFSFFISMIVVLFFSGYRLLSTVDSSYIRFATQIVFIIDVVTLLLFYLSGEYHRTIVRPRKFVVITNKGLRQLNIRLVKVRVRMYDALLVVLKSCFLIPIRVLKMQTQYLSKVVRVSSVAKFRNWLVELEIKLATSNGGVTDVKIVLNPRVFSTDIREQWELYRNEFWNKETMRRRRIMVRERKDR
ncbi:hypothetical protein KL930_003786 [Ogataea haglerorum]|uniref:Sporulation-specific protein SPO7 n=1 Tax=Ogataea haglerorum TaxID=1937702 RepID=A0AAN6I014_9ASCO|nr:uncharacterized protein KL911_003925 [Ogataea haglerorum]KAG7695333.1 hypothetical protein KL951_003775 [Ogataea haglerorum]KAG7726270.1 hypothetical protein KL933_003712 [Ogataea haglerorum]KAG7729488.1 hypothetical protein KL948_003642 [Ogataea haglerorum]KAG7737062.1 hypothetical protein KL923_004200 [Ogataea haglerorum]KAG7746890.1 hypothetical protein KL912_004019 [Ogataea haglerorum]